MGAEIPVSGGGVGGVGWCVRGNRKKGLAIRKVLTAAALLCAAGGKVNPVPPSIDREVVCLLSGVLECLGFSNQSIKNCFVRL